MTTVTAASAAIPLIRPRAPARPSRPAAWATLARRRISLSAHTPREILAPLATPLLFALVIAPALAKIIQAAGGGGADYSTFVIVGTVGLLIPLTCTFAGIGVIVDRASGARRELLTAPIPRALIVLGNMAVAIGVSLLQVGALMAAGWLRGSHFHATASGVAWFTGAVLAFTVLMYGLAEILANRIPTPEEYIGLTPVVAILPWFIAGALFPITALPAWLAAVARALPTTHVLALLRYGVLDRTGAGLHDIWGMTSTHHHRRRPQPAGPGRLGDPHHRSSHPRLHPLGSELTRTPPPEPARRAHTGARRAPSDRATMHQAGIGAGPGKPTQASKRADCQLACAPECQIWGGGGRQSVTTSNGAIRRVGMWEHEVSALSAVRHRRSDQTSRLPACMIQPVAPTPAKAPAPEHPGLFLGQVLQIRGRVGPRALSATGWIMH